MEQNYQFRKRLLQIHKPNRRTEEAIPSRDDVSVTDEWTVTLPSVNTPVLYRAARDLVDYFAVSMGVFVKLTPSRAGEKRIDYEIDPLMGENRYCICVQENRIALIGADARLAARAGYLLEDLMNLNEGPFVAKGTVERQSLYAPRMIHSGYGMDLFPDQYMNQIVHSGFTSLLIYVRDVEKDHEYNDIISRAEEFGLDVYAYSALKSRVYPEGEEGVAFYDSLYGELFRRCPGFKGVVFVGESVEFPSRDPNTSGRLRLDNIGPDGKKIVNKVSPGWYPCCDFHLWIEMVRNIIRKERQDADIVVWSYNWGYQDREKRLELIRKLPDDISLLVTFEMFENVPKDDSFGRTVDYSLFFPGPGQYFVSEAEEAKRRGIRLYAMVNTGGLTWDVGVIPYEPAPYQWLKRYRAMREAHNLWGLCGTMESHHFGWHPSFISEFCKWMFESPDQNPDEILKLLAARDFHRDCVNEVLRAWQLFSKGIENLVSTGPDQYGPFRVGPAYPLLFLKNEFVFPSRPGFVHNHNKICRPMYQYDISTPEKLHKFQCEIRWYSEVSELFDEGASLLEGTFSRLSPAKRENAERLVCLARFVARTACTAVNVKKWYLEKQILLGEFTAEEKRIAAQKMKTIAESEIQNAENTVDLVRFDSRLGYEPSMDYMCDEAHLRFKINATRQVAEEELSPYLN